MKISTASDHAGYELKEAVVAYLRELGHDVVDHGADSAEAVDYPLYAQPASRDVADGNAEVGMLVCGSGVGVAIVANKIKGVRAVNAHDPLEAEMSRRHNNANVLCLSGGRLSADQAKPIVDAFLSAEFEGGRHERRVDQIDALEAS